MLKSMEKPGIAIAIMSRKPMMKSKMSKNDSEESDEYGDNPKYDEMMMGLAGDIRKAKSDKEFKDSLFQFVRMAMEMKD